MGATWKQAAAVSAAWLCLAGCAANRFQPAGFTEIQHNQAMNEVRYTSDRVRLGEPVQITFHPGAVDRAGTALNGTLTGYFYAYNKWNGTVSVSSKPITLFNRGEVYYIETIASITPLPETQPLMQQVKATPSLDLMELTLVRSYAQPEFQPELRTR
jgi:hypothetical protein